MDPVALPEKVLARLGYLSEDRDLPQWVTIGELMKYSSAFYPDWDQAYAEELRLRLGLDDLQAKVKHLSRGERAKAGLLVALAYRPELLVLDEPSAGLDAAVRRHILGAIIRTVAEEGRTVLFSSHLLDEVERVSDHVAMLVNGRILFAGALDEIRASHRLLGYRFPIPMSSAPSLPGALAWEGMGQDWTVVCNGQLDALKQAAAEMKAELTEDRPPSLEEVFLARSHVGRHGTGR